MHVCDFSPPTHTHTHRDGIVFALSKSPGKKEEEEEDPLAPPPHLDFLLVLSEFSFRLLDVDRHGNKGVIPYLKSQVPGEVWEEGGEEWESFRIYRNSLSGKDQDTANTSEPFFLFCERVCPQPLVLCSMVLQAEQAKAKGNRPLLLQAKARGKLRKVRFSDSDTAVCGDSPSACLFQAPHSQMVRDGSVFGQQRS